MMSCKNTFGKWFGKLCFFKLNFKQISLEAFISVEDWPLSSGLQTYYVSSPQDPTSWLLLPDCFLVHSASLSWG